MVNIIFKQSDGTQNIVDIAEGLSIMEAAIKHNIDGIEADCGGGCSCATCHVYIDNTFTDKTGLPSNAEEDMLDFAFDVRPNSRLSCQVRVTNEMNNIIVHIPNKQI
jgi:2Fe-2S ferredoxin